MKIVVSVLALMMISPGACLAQFGGNAVYAQPAGHAQAEQNEVRKRAVTKEEMPPSGTSMFLEASVLMNVKADEYIAIFGITQEGSTIVECNQKCDAVIQSFADELKTLGIGAKDYFVDFVAQNKIYAYEVTGEIAREKLSGFEIKKNVSIHFRDKILLDKLVIAASHSDIFDLIKVDYIVKDMEAVQNKLMEEAARVVKLKAARYERLFGIKLQAPAQVYAEKPSVYFPAEMYDSYTAYESEDVSAGYYRQKYIIQNARKSRTFYFNALNAKGFDYVVNPVIIEPVVQFTLYLKLKYETGQGKQKEGGKTNKGS